VARPGRVRGVLTLVTGATGYLGLDLVRDLRAQGRKVRALVRSDKAAQRLDGLGVELAHGDITDPEAVARAVDGCARIFHMAGYVGHRAREEPAMQRANVDGAKVLLDAAQKSGVERVVFTSSVATMGPAGSPHHPRDEGAWMLDGDDGRADFRYARSKAAGEQEALRAAAAGLDVVVTNPGFVIGPGDINRVSSWPIEEYMRGLLRFTVDGGLSYVDGRDVVAGHLLAEQKGVSGQRYILTNEQGNLSHRDFFALVGRVSGKRRRQLNAPVGLLRPLLRVGNMLRLPLPLDDHELASSAHWWFYNPAKARAELGFETRPIEQTVLDTVAWLQADGYHRH
jgi:dihydroflavonol-4-reductase